MGELILHIGTRKTGTSALQLFFCNNRDNLAKNGVDYVQFTPQPKEAFGARRNGFFLKRYCLALLLQKEISSQVSDFEENYKRLAEALEGNKRVLLSDEDYSAITNLTFNKKIEPREFWRILVQVLNELGVKNTTIIVYLRRQDEYVISHWKEMVKGGHTDITLSEYLSQPYIESELDYKKMMDTIRDSFGSSARIIVRSYNQVSSSQDGIIHDFCEALEIPWDDDYKLSKKRINEGMSYDVTEALRHSKYGVHGCSGEKQRTRRNLARILSQKHPDPKGTSILSPIEAKTLMNQYSDGNRRIAEEYCDNKSLFSDEFSEDSVWHPNRLRIAQYRVAFLYPKLSLKLCSISKRAKQIIKKTFK